MVASVTSRPRRVATRERWVKALQRAFDNGVQVFQVASTGAWIATSTSKPGIAHQTDGIECSCEAWLNGDPICTHRAAVLHALGKLDLDTDPEPTTPAPVVALPAPMCSTCDDARSVTVANRIRPGLTFQKPCPDCAAKNALPTLTFRPDTTEGDQPSTRPCRRCDRTGTELNAAGVFVDCRDCEGTGAVPRAVLSLTYTATPITA